MKLSRVFVLALVTATRAAYAEDAVHPGKGGSSVDTADEQSRSAFEAGQAAYERGDYETASNAFQRAYELLPAPALLYNRAQAERRDGQCEAALAHYRQFVATYSGPFPADTEEKIAEVRRCVAAKVKPPASGEPIVQPAWRFVAVPSRPASPVWTERRTVPTWAGWTAAGVGVAGVVAGSILAAMVVHQQSVVEHDCPGKLCNDDRGMQAASEGRALLIGSIVAYAVGAAGLGFGIYVWEETPAMAADRVRAKSALPTSGVLTWSTSL